MTSEIKSTDDVVSCSDNGQHPLIYINLKNGRGQCQYCGQIFVRVSPEEEQKDQEAA